MIDWIVQNPDVIAKSLALVGGLFSFGVYVRVELTQLKADLKSVIEHQKIFMDSLKQLNIILTQIAVQDTRLNMMEKDIDELRHRKGFID